MGLAAVLTKMLPSLSWIQAHGWFPSTASAVSRQELKMMLQHWNNVLAWKREKSSPMKIIFTLTGGLGGCLLSFHMLKPCLLWDIPSCYCEAWNMCSSPPCKGRQQGMEIKVFSTTAETAAIWLGRVSLLSLLIMAFPPNRPHARMSRDLAARGKGQCNANVKRNKWGHL